MWTPHVATKAGTWLFHSERPRRRASLNTTLGANAIIGMRYDATEIASGTTEGLAYGTAVVVERAP